MIKIKTLNKFCLLSLFLLIASCSMAPVKFDYDTKQVPEKFEEQTTSFQVKADKVSPVKWWERFNDPQLNDLITDVLKENLDIRLAVTRYQSIGAMFDMARGQRYPAVSLGGGYTRKEGPVPGLALTSAGPVATNSVEAMDNYSFRSGLSFEIDVWGKLKSREEGAMAQLMASEADMQTVYLSIISGTINLYFDIRAMEQELEYTGQSLKNYKRNQKLLKKRYISGTAPRNGYDQTVRAYEGAKYKQEQLESGLRKMKHALAVLAGKYPTDKMLKGDFVKDTPNLDIINSGLPSDLLKNRADILSSYYQMEAARHEAGAVKAELFPSFKLTAALVSSVADIEDLFSMDYITRSVGAEVSQVLFAGGSKMANHDRSLELYAASILTYRKTVLNAFKDVEDALVTLDAGVRQEKSMKQSLKAAERIRFVSQSNYLAGTGGYSDLVEADQALFSARSSYLNTEKNLVKARVQLHKSLGGRWVGEK